jgi:TctA family transporter
MTTAAALLDGLLRATAWPAIGLLLVGILLGAVVGILPGLSGAVMLAMVLPFAVGLSPTGAFALMIGIATVTATTGDLTSILLGVPGEPGAAATILDGHPMARRGEARRAIGASLVSSLAGSIFGAIALAVAIPFVSPITRSLASPELFMFALLGIALVAPLSKGSKVKGLAAGGIGLMLSTIGLDSVGATPRFTFGRLFLWEGVGAIPLALGLFAIPEIVEMAAMGANSAAVPSTTGGSTWSGVRDVGRLWRVVVRSSAIGTIVGFLPGVGTSVSQWVAYADAAGHSSSQTNFGDGAIEGVIAPSAANNATLGGALAPTLALGIPGSLMSAMLLSALVVKGLVPGPRLLMPDSQGGQLTLVFSLVWFMLIGNLFAVALSFCAMKPLIRLARVRAGRLVPFLILLVFIGAYTERQAIADLFITSLLGLLGLALMRYRWPRAPVLMGLVLGPLAENRLSLSMEAFGFSWMARPGVIAIALLLIAGFALSKGAPAHHQPDDRIGTPAASSAIEYGELVFTCILFVMLLGGFVAAGAYPARAATLPRLVALVTMPLLVAAFVSQLKSGRSNTADVLPVHVAHLASPAIWWIPLFLTSLWSLGFIVGAPLAILGYLVFETREHPVRSVAIGLCTYLVLEIALHRLLSVSLWEGALQAWVG